MVSSRRVHVAGSSFFFFQAEDGIRDVAVTGVQTCALPISPRHAINCEAIRTRQRMRREHRAPLVFGHVAQAYPIRLADHADEDRSRPAPPDFWRVVLMPGRRGPR